MTSEESQQKFAAENDGSTSWSENRFRLAAINQGGTVAFCTDKENGVIYRYNFTIKQKNKGDFLRVR
jgi:hypothetical protein